jgi:hypothetical protein
MVKYIRETTDNWQCDFRVPCHTYIVESGRSGRMLGYIKEGTTEAIMNKKPMPFDRRGRSFKELGVKERAALCS